MNIIPDKVLNILKGCRVEGNKLYLPNVQLSRSDYTAVNRVLTNLGGNWNRKAKAHLFESDIEDVFEAVVESGRYEAKLDELNKVFNFFPTPLSVALKMIREADVQPGETVLEPSAGRGDLADEIRKAVGSPDVCEIHHDMKHDLMEKHYNVVADDFMELEQQYDVIIMNPPFSKGRDALHLLHALTLAKRQVVCIMGAGICFRKNTPYREARELIEELGGTITSLPEGAFRESGTMVGAVMVSVNTEGLS